MPYVSRQIQTINGHQRTHYTAQGQMVFDEISLNAIAKLRRDCSGWWHYPPTVQNKKQTNRNNLLVACSAHTNIGSSKVREGTQLMENLKAFPIKARGEGLGLHLSFFAKKFLVLLRVLFKMESGKNAINPPPFYFGSPPHGSRMRMMNTLLSMIVGPRALLFSCPLYSSIDDLVSKSVSQSVDFWFQGLQSPAKLW